MNIAGLCTHTDTVKVFIVGISNKGRISILGLVEEIEFILSTSRRSDVQVSKEVSVMYKLSFA